LCTCSWNLVFPTKYFVSLAHLESQSRMFMGFIERILNQEVFIFIFSFGLCNPCWDACICCVCVCIF